MTERSARTETPACPSRWPTNAEEVVTLLREVGLRRLMGSDGCNCGYVMLRGYHIDRSCHKSESSLRVYAQGVDSMPADLALIATEALAQMREEDGWSDILVRYCDYTHDHKGSKWGGKSVGREHWDLRLLLGAARECGRLPVRKV
jgi:hypothetical protein